MREVALFDALGITLAVAAATVGVFHAPVQRLLTKIARDADLALFWTLFCDATLLLFPIAMLLFGSVLENTNGPFAVVVGEYVKWGIFGSIISLFTLAATVACVVQPMGATLEISREQVTDMQRLLSTVDQMRARKVLRRVPNPSDS